MPKLPGSEAIRGPEFQDAYAVQSYRGGLAEEGQIRAAETNARAAGQLADTAFKFTEERLQAEQRIQYATAQQDFITKKSELDAKAATDRDYTTLPQRYEADLKAAAAQSAQRIGGAPAKEHFLAQMGLHVASGTATIRTHAITQAKEADRGWLTEFIDSGVKSAIASPDEAANNTTFTAINNAITGMAQKGSITEPEAVKLRKTTADHYATGRATMLMDNDPAAAVQALRPTGTASDGTPTFESTDDWRDKLDPVKRANIWRQSQVRYAEQVRAGEVDAARQERLQLHAQQQASDDAENRIIAATSGPQAAGVTASQIADPKGAYNQLLPAAKLRMIGFVDRQNKGEPTAAVSHALAVDLVSRIRTGEIADLGPVFDAYAKKDADGNPTGLTNGDFNFVRQAFVDRQSPEGDRLGKRVEDFLKAVKPSIDKANPLMGNLDMTGGTLFFQLQQDLAAKVAEYRKAGKDPFDLLNPSKPDYVGRPDALAQYQKSIPESVDTIAARLRQGGTPTGAAPAKPTRQPDETPEQYLKRIGAQ